MSRILHRSKVYSQEYYLSCICFGMAAGCAESIAIWMTLSFDISFPEVVKFNIFALIVGAITGLFASLIGILAHRLFQKKIEFSHQVHQTSWAFAIAVSLYYAILVIGGLLGNRALSIVFGLVLVPLVFILIYQFASKFLFRRRVAGRLSIEAFVTIVLLIYLVKHPGFSKEIPFTQPAHPHFFLFNISDLVKGEESAQKLKSCFPEEQSESLFYFPHTFPVSMQPKTNFSEVFSLNLNDDSSYIFNTLQSYGYHTGYLSLKSLADNKYRKNFDTVDDQSYNLGTRLKEFRFCAKILFFLDLEGYIARFENGEIIDGTRSPAKMLNRMTSWIKRERDAEPFFIVAQLAFNPLKSANPNFNGLTALKDALQLMHKSSILDYSVVFFTSIDSLAGENPLFIYIGGVATGEVFPENFFSQKDIAGTIVSILTNSDKSTGYSYNLNRLLQGETLSPRLVYTWKDQCGEEIPAMRAGYYPWVLNKTANNELHWEYFDIKAVASEPSSADVDMVKNALKQYIENPNFRISQFVP